MSFRRQLRTFATLALVMQSAWVLAIVPLDCCAAHETPRAKPSCHEEVAAAHCLMKDSQGAACPMHQKGRAIPDQPCRMKSTCSGPMAGLVALLTIQGVLPDTQSFGPVLTGVPYRGQSREQLTSRFVPPESPPPRA
jgi:hypothetical protein